MYNFATYVKYINSRITNRFKKMIIKMEVDVFSLKHIPLSHYINYKHKKDIQVDAV